ncbi:MAG TPA: ABC transporter permease [Pseudothermotoga sp.]|nr:ABC transporter permease [Pseudothermotoga sp.]HOK82967.1 ABC transporter permease [Pseudothermotoga sp.]HPP69864.1 ABC transporter permease [Pseudothermotoga sp.]
MFWNLLKKELREVLTVSSVVVVVVVSFVYGFIGRTVGSVEKEISKKPLVAVVNLDKEGFGKAIEQSVGNFADVVYMGENIDDGLKKLQDNGGTALLVIDESFTRSIQSGEKGKIKVLWMLRGLGIADTISSTVFERFCKNVEDQVRMSLMTEYGVENPQLVMNPVEKVDATFFNKKTFDGLSPSQLLNLTSSQTTMTSVVMMMLIIMAGTTVISSMGLEKENKTLETLMTMPVKRSYIVFSKILAATIAGLVMAGIYMVGFNFYMKSFTISSTASLGLTLNTWDYVLVGISLFSALLCGIGMSMFLGIISKDFKTAQTMTFPLTALAIFSMLVTMFKDFSSLSMPLKVIIFAIPFTHPMLSIRNLLFGKSLFVIYGCIYNIVLSVILISLITRIFNSDRLIVGVSLRKAKRQVT